MTRFQYLALAGPLFGLPVAASAQNNAAPANIVTPAPPPREGTVGPEQLRDFALPGTRTAPAPSTQTPPVAAPATTRTPATRVAPPPVTTRPATEQPAATARPRSDRPAAAAPATASQPTTPATATSLPSASLGLTPAPQSASPALPPVAVSQSGTEAPSLLQGWWPWLLVAALAGVGLALVLRQRRRPVLAGHDEQMFERAAPEPEPLARVPSPPQPAPAPPPPAAPPLPTGLVTTRLRQPQAQRQPTSAPTPAAPISAGIVSVRLRGWVEVNVAVREILFDGNDARLRLDFLVANTGTGGVRDIALEALTLNGGDDQAAELAAFYARPAGAQPAIPELGARSDTLLSHELVMPRGAIRAYEAQGRTLFVPIVALNASYRSASGEGRTSAAFLVGRDVPGSDKLAPLLLPEGAGRQLGLGVRRLDEAVRR